MDMHRRFAATLSAILGKPQVTADDLIRKDRRRSKADAGESSSFHGELHNDALDLQTIATNDLKVETVTRVTRATDVDSRGSSVSLKIGQDFIAKFSKGVIIKSASHAGGLHSILIKVSDSNFSWGAPDARKLYNTSLKDIGCVHVGVPIQLESKYSDEVQLRAFYIQRKSSSAVATFVTASPKHRDALVMGLRSVISSDDH